MNLIPSKLTTLMILSTIILSPINGLAQHLPTPEKKATITAFIPQINSDKKSVLSKKLKCFSGKSVVTCDGSANLKLVVGSNPGFITITNTSSITATGITFTSLPSGITAAAAQPFPPIPVCTASLLPGDSCLLWVQATAATATSPITIQGSNTQATTINVEAYNVGDPYPYQPGFVYKGVNDTIFITLSGDLFPPPPGLEWAIVPQSIPGANSLDNGDTNTQAIIAADFGANAAFSCTSFGMYLPAVNELNSLLTIASTNPSLGILGAQYWSSTWDSGIPLNAFYIVNAPTFTPLSQTQADTSTYTQCIQVVS